MRRLIDLSHTVEHGMVTYPGLPGPVIADYQTREASQAHYAPGTTFHIGKIEMVGNTGTYIDAPFHRYAEGNDLAAIRLEQVADLEGRVFRSDPAQRAIGPELFKNEDLCNLELLPDSGFRFHAVPVKVRGFSSFPVRAYAIVSG